MTRTEPKSKRFFTEVARAKALEVRRAKAAIVSVKDPHEMFVVRSPLGDNGFGWEVRRFGGVIIARSAIGFASAIEAHSAGYAALGRGPAPEPTDSEGDGQFNGGYLGLVAP